MNRSYVCVLVAQFTPQMILFRNCLLKNYNYTDLKAKPEGTP